MQALKKQVDSTLASASRDQGLCLLLTGDGKGKTSSAFGMLMRSLAYGKSVGIVQFIKGEQASGEENYIRQRHPDIPFYQMGTGFTWDTQDREADIRAARQTWSAAEKLLKDESIELLLLDELTYMLIQIPGRAAGTGCDSQSTCRATCCDYRQRRERP